MTIGQALEKLFDNQIMIRDLHLESFQAQQLEEGFNFLVDGEIVLSFELVLNARKQMIIWIVDRISEEKTFVLVEGSYWNEDVQIELRKKIEELTKR